MSETREALRQTNRQHLDRLTIPVAPASTGMDANETGRHCARRTDNT
ncbi:MAG: hypothetical protein K0U66_00105 [Gammaproteobacteria bacterium]|nr:hypothetical protein [Gammaproteobacteria bacterium]